jgi:uncharacterized protein (TIGR03083 family)
MDRVEWDTLVAAWAGTVENLLALASDCDDADFALATECPGWTVKDQLAHVVGIERTLLGEPDPPVDVPDLDHVHGALGRRLERAVHLRREVPGTDVLAELDGVVRRRVAALSAPDADPNAPAEDMFGPTKLGELMRLRTFDCWTHEQDVRRALGRPGGLESAAAGVAVRYVRRLLPRVVAKGAKVPAGRVAQFEVDGPVSFREAIHVTAGEGSKPRGTVLDEPVEILDDGQDVALRLGTEAFMRRAAGRWSVEETPVTVRGDAALGGAVLKALAITP